MSDLYCAECARELTLLQDDICGFCADKLQARIAELEKYRIEGVSLKTIEAVNESFRKKVDQLEAALDNAGHELYGCSGSCPSDLYDWEHPNTCSRECDRYDNPDEAWKCWRLWLLEQE